MKYINLLIVIFTILSSCSTNKNNLYPRTSYSKANRGILSGKSKIVQKPTMIRLGIKPLSLQEAKPYMKNIFYKLIPELEKTNITYQMAGNDILLTIQSHILLDEKLNILQSISKQLDNIIKILVMNNRNYIEIVGHTSSVGNSYNNLVKSQNMAINTAKYFMDKGIIPARIFMTGMGENHWIASNNTIEGRYLNNRVEIKISPII